MDYKKAEKQAASLGGTGKPRSWNIKNEEPREDLRADIRVKTYPKGKPVAKQPKYNY